MAADLAAFRKAFPALASVSDGAVEDKLETAALLVDARRFGRLADKATLYYAAHLTALEAAASAAQAGGGIGAIPGGAVASKSLGGASKSYDNTVGLPEGAGLYGATSYGRQFYQWLRMFGAGGIQL